MIGFLSGIIKFRETNIVILDVNGVGYEIFVPVFIWQECKIGEKKEFYVYSQIREDAINFFGFNRQEEKQIFSLLLSVSGIGPKIALNILSYANGVTNIIRAIQNADVDFFDDIKGLGKKSSQRIIVDLKTKVGGLKELDFAAEADLELIEALKGLGFSQEEIRKSIKGIKPDLSLEEKIKLALKEN